MTVTVTATGPTAGSGPSPVTPTTARPTGMRAFMIIWIGQFVSVVGSATSAFALGVWVYQDTGSVTRFGVSLVCGYLPGIVIAPIAGVMVDRYSRRAVLIACDAAAAAAMGVIVLAWANGSLNSWYVYGFQIVASLCVAFQWPAFSASLTQLVAPEKLGRANGLANVGQAVAELVAPLAAGILLAQVHMGGIIAFDFASYLVAVVTLAVVSIPAPPHTEEPHRAVRGALSAGLHWLAARRGLLGLALFFAVYNFVTGAVTVLVTPLVLAFAPVSTLGFIASAGGAGMVIGGVLMSVWGGPVRHRTAVIFGTAAMAGCTLVVAGAWPGVVVLAAVSFAYFLFLPIMNTCSQTIWQLKTDPDKQGRVFSARRMIAQSCVPVSYLVIGFVAARASPAMAEHIPGGTLFGPVGGGERGSALVLAAMGVLAILTSIAAYAHPRIRKVETELPDVVR